jgi:hypothetical protein
LPSRRKKNLLSLKNLQDNLKTHNKSIFKIPIVLQYNKRDLGQQGIDILPIETLEKDLNSKLRVSSFEASALAGTDVATTLKKIIVLTMHTLENQLK